VIERHRQHPAHAWRGVFFRERRLALVQARPDAEDRLLADEHVAPPVHVRRTLEPTFDRGGIL